jgi:hypothetical protein
MATIPSGSNRERWSFGRNVFTQSDDELRAVTVGRLRSGIWIKGCRPLPAHVRID